MFQMLIHPSSGACDYLVRYCVGCIVLTWGVLVLCSGIGCWWCGIRVQAVQPALGYHKFLKMDVLTSETCWAVNWHNKASVIKLVYPYSNIKMMHGPIRIRFITRYFKNIYVVRPNDPIARYPILSCHYYLCRLFSLKIATLYKENKRNGQEVSHPYAIANKSDILFKDILNINSFSTKWRLLFPFQRFTQF